MSEQAGIIATALHLVFNWVPRPEWTSSCARFEAEAEVQHKDVHMWYRPLADKESSSGVDL